MFRYIIVALTCLVSSGILVEGKFLGGKFSASGSPLGIVQNPRSCNDAEPDPRCSTLKEVRMTNCTVQPCMIIPDTEYLFEVDFESKFANNDIHLVVKALIGGIPFELFEGNLGSGTIPGQSYSITYEMLLPDELSGIEFVTNAVAKGLPSNQTEFCVDVDGKVI